MDMDKMLKAQRRGYALSMRRRGTQAAIVYALLMLLAFLGAVGAAVMYPDLLKPAEAVQATP